MSDCIGTGCKAASLMARLETQAEAHAAEVAGLESVRAEQAAGREYWCNEAQRLTAERDALSDLLNFIGTASTGLELFPCGPSDIEYAEDGNTIVRYVGPWRFLEGEGDTFIEAVRAAKATSAQGGTPT
jgi:hypothetical protein